MAKKFHLGLFSSPPVMHHTVGGWKHPRNIKRGYRWDRPEVWQHCARLAEGAKFDFVFSAEIGGGVYDAYQNDFRPAVRYGVQTPCFEQSVLHMFMAAATEHIGFVPTVSINGKQPWHVARMLATMDHLSGGRTGWNLVCSFQKIGAQNLGMEDQLEHRTRYERADEFAEVCHRLWTSWEPDAVVMDAERDIFADPEKVHPINFVGKYFTCRGPLNIHRCPQGEPLFVQAGQSPTGVRFAAQRAECIFSIQTFVAGMKRAYDAYKETAVKEFGRDPDSMKIMFAMMPVVGETEEIAHKKAALIRSLTPVEGGLVWYSAALEYDLSKLDPNAPFDEHLQVPGIQGILDAYTKVEQGRRMTVGEIAKGFGEYCGDPLVVGTAEQIADWMEETMETVGGDGFLVCPAYVPGMVEEFVDLVVPILQERGVVRTEYITGGTLRDNLMAF